MERLAKYKYCCLNPNCSTTFVVVEKKESEKEVEEWCPDCSTDESDCDQVMKLMGEYAYNLGRFRMMSRQERQQLLLKRSKNHAKTKLADRISEMNKNPMKYSY